MEVTLLLACLTLTVVSGGKVQVGPESWYEGENTLANNGEEKDPVVDVFPYTPHLNNGNNEDIWQFSPLENSNKDYLYDYVSDSWMGEEDSPYYYEPYYAGKSRGERDDKETGKDEVAPKHRRKYRKLRSLHRRSESGLHKGFRSTRKAPQIITRKIKRTIRAYPLNLLKNAESVHPSSDLQFNPRLGKRDVQLQMARADFPEHIQKFRMPINDMKRLRRQLKSHQLEYFTDNAGDTQLNVPSKAEGTERDLLPLEAPENDSEEELGIQYDKVIKDAPLNDIL